MFFRINGSSDGGNTKFTDYNGFGGPSLTVWIYYNAFYILPSNCDQNRTKNSCPRGQEAWKIGKDQKAESMASPKSVIILRQVKSETLEKEEINFKKFVIVTQWV